MPTLNFSTSFKKNCNEIISPEELLDTYFYGINISEDKKKFISDKTIRKFIKSAQQEVEKWLNIKIVKQVIQERKDFNRNDWYSWGFIRTTYPVNYPLLLEGFLGLTKQITYPAQWLSTNISNDGFSYYRQVSLVPSTNSPSNFPIYTGIIPNIGLTGAQNIPNYWEITYLTGFDVVPDDLLNFIGMLASINVFYLLGDVILSIPGIASQSIGIDGLSQSYSAKSDGYGQRIKGYLELMNGQNGSGGMREKIYNFYKGFTISSF